MAVPPPPRDLALDSLRGSDVLLMILVNVQGSSADAFPQLAHVAWHGLTLADLVFPLFLLIVGLSAPLALNRPGADASAVGILRRVLLLFAIGMALSWLIRPSFDPAMVRWTGVLQRIAIVYLVCAAVVVAARRWPPGPGWRAGGLAAAVAAAMLLGHSLLILLVGAPGGGAPGIGPGEGISGWLDRQFIPGRVLRQSWDPEGVLSTLPAIATGLIGVAVMQRMQTRQLGNAALAALGGSMALAAAAITPWLPINKNLWTASFALIASGTGLTLWALLRAGWPIVGGTALARWTVQMGQAALTLYVVHMVLIALLVRKLPDGQRIWDVSYGWLAAAIGAGGGAALIYAVAAMLLSAAALGPLRRRGWLLRV